MFLFVASLSYNMPLCHNELIQIVVYLFIFRVIGELIGQHITPFTIEGDTIKMRKDLLVLLMIFQLN